MRRPDSRLPAPNAKQNYSNKLHFSWIICGKAVPLKKPGTLSPDVSRYSASTPTTQEDAAFYVRSNTDSVLLLRPGLIQA